eukprot:COSAG02_NODE_21796_length_774_cov_4.531852_2_plen_46_part_01
MVHVVRRQATRLLPVALLASSPVDSHQAELTGTGTVDEASLSKHVG